MSLEMFINDEVIQMMKVCTKCKKVMPATPEYFVTDKRNKSGLYCWCKECKRKDTADRIAALSPEQRDIHNENQTKYKRGRAIQTAFQGKRGRAKKDGTEWNLGEAKGPEEAVWQERMKTTTHCPDCACEITWFQKGNSRNDSGSFDRIDSNVGYLEGNVRITCTGCNTRKSNSPVDEWVGLLKVRIEKGIIECVDEILLSFLSERAPHIRPAYVRP